MVCLCLAGVLSLNILKIEKCPTEGSYTTKATTSRLTSIFTAKDFQEII